ncbi:MAG TPA: hypothetical protein PKH32_14450, partial [Verrucomicrobiota bacterium]|nr:hypothetical protein [Verrucomicrobiota bacterium]
LPYSGENFHSIPPTFNSDTQWQILPGSALSVDAPFLNPRLSAQQGSAPDEVELTWQGYANATYVVESSTDLLNWTEVTGELPGMDAIMTRVLTRSAPHEFFRVKLIPGD